MGRYVIAVGGSGSKVLEAMVYAACAGAFYAPDAPAPIDALDMLSVDVDAACGNTTRAKRAAEYYEQVRAALETCALPRPCFHTRLSLNRWSMDLTRRAASVSQMARAHERDRLLARTLFTRDEADLEYSEGFRGHPDLGVLFFAGLLGALDQARAQGQPDELNALIDRMQADIDRGDTVQLLLTGSIFGGTGASGIPALSKYLRRRFAHHADRFVMGSALLLPYYHVPPAEGDGVAVSSGEFMDKARTALQYYGMEGMVRDGEHDAHGVFDAVYLLGLPPEHFVSTRLYSTGSQSQENDAHMLEWLAARCAARFFATGFRGAHAHNIDCYYYQSRAPRFGWDTFDGDGPLYRARYGAMMKSAAVYLTECYPTLRAHVCGEGRGLGRVGYCAAFFSRARRAPAARRALLGARLDALYHFFAFYVNWMRQLIGALPPAFRGADGPAGCLPHNDLMDGALLDALHRALTASGSGGRDGEACRMVQRGLERLVVSPVPDRRDMARVIGGLGGGAPSTGPDDGFAAFVSTLLAASMEEA